MPVVPSAFHPVNSSIILRRLLLALLLLAAFIPAGCIRNLGREPAWGKPSTLEFQIEEHVQVPPRLAVVFLCDGLDLEVFNEMLAAGDLPHIDHYLVRRGVLVENAISSLPTITFGSTVSLITGVRAGRHGILGNNWFDPQLLVLRRYGHIGTMSLVNDDFTQPTLFELLDREHTLVVTIQAHRGATTWHENWLRLGPAWFFRMFHNINMTTTARMQNAATEANESGRFPDLFFLYYPATDEVGHIHGIDSANYRDILRSFDNEVGDACKALEEQGLLDRALLVLVTDHGMANVREHFNAAAELQLCGIRTTSAGMGERDGYYQKRSAHFNRFQAVVLSDGARHVGMTFRQAGMPWISRPSLASLRAFAIEDEQGRPTQRTVDLIALSLAMPATQYVAHGDRHPTEPRVHLFNTVGNATITRRAASNGKSLYCYEVVSGKDPLGYTNHAAAAGLVGGEFYDENAWIAATVETAYPAGVVELSILFDSIRAGDIVLFAQPGWDFGADNRSGHGGMTRQEVVTPMIFAGPGIVAGGRLPWALTLSVTPTVLHFLRNERDPAIFAQFDADSLLDILTGQVENVWSTTPAPALPDAR